MEKVITLRKGDWEIVNKLNNEYPKELLKESFDRFVKKRLRYNMQTGKTYLGRELIAEFTHSQDIEKYDNREDVIKWQFMGNIKNGCSRKMRGYDIIG